MGRMINGKMRDLLQESIEITIITKKNKQTITKKKKKNKTKKTQFTAIGKVYESS